MKSVQIRRFFWSVFSCVRTELLIYGVNLRIQSEYRKIRTRKTSVFGHFSRSVMKSRNQEGYGNFKKLTIIKRSKFHLTLNMADKMHFKEREHVILKNKTFLNVSFLKCCLFCLTLLFLNLLCKKVERSSRRLYGSRQSHLFSD